MEALSKPQFLRRKLEKAKNCPPSPKKSAQECTGGVNGYDFLAHAFQPVIETNLDDLMPRAQVEASFFPSLKNLESFYNLTSLSENELPYPLNISAAFDYAEQQLRAINKNIQLAIVQDDTHSATLATVITLNLQYTLNYIPTFPLKTLMEDPSARATLNLLYSIFSWLRQVNGVSYFLHNESLVAYCYDTIYTTLDEEVEETGMSEQEVDTAREAFEIMTYWGEKIKGQIEDPKQLSRFANRIACFTPQNEFQEEVYKIAQEVYLLYLGGENIIDYLYSDFFMEEGHEEESPILYSEYVSFFWEGADAWMDEQLEESITCELQEKQAMDLPLGFQFFDVLPSMEFHDLTYPYAFFSIIEKLSFTLYNLKNEK